MQLIEDAKCRKFAIAFDQLSTYIRDKQAMGLIDEFYGWHDTEPVHLSLPSYIGELQVFTRCPAFEQILDPEFKRLCKEHGLKYSTQGYRFNPNATNPLLAASPILEEDEIPAEEIVRIGVTVKLP
jgi:hypothetical protein